MNVEQHEVHLANYSVNAIILLVLQLRSVMDALKTHVYCLLPDPERAALIDSKRRTQLSPSQGVAAPLNAAH